MRESRPLLRIIWFIAAFWALSTSLAQAKDNLVWQRTLKEYLGHHWEKELVHFPVQSDVMPDVSSHRLMLVNENGIKEEIAYQTANLRAGKTTKKWYYDLYCIIDLPPFSERSLQLETVPASINLARQMATQRSDGVIRIDSGAVMIEIPGKSSPRTDEEKIPAPLLRMQNAEASRWIGRGHFKGVGALENFALQIEPGPVFTDANLNYSFEKGKYSVHLRLIREQPVVLWEEKFDLNASNAHLIWDCSAGQEISVGLWQYHLTKYGYRKTNMGTSRSYSPDFDKGPEVTTFAPWIPWWKNDVTTWMELWDKEKKWAFGLFTGNPLEWNPGDQLAYTNSAFHLKIRSERQALLELPLWKGKRVWGMSLAKRTPDSKIGVNRKVSPTDTACRQIKYGETPLDEVKDYVFDYEGAPPESYPQFLFTPAMQKELLFALDSDRPFLGELKAAIAWAQETRPIEEKEGFWRMGVYPDQREWPKLPKSERLLKAAIAGIRGPYETHLRCELMRRSLEAVRFILWHGTGPAMSVAPHNWMTDGPLNYLSALADVGLPMLTPREREILRARMLFLAYKLSSERFWSPKLELAGTANMTTMIYAHLAFISLLYPGHPMAAEWRQEALNEINHELENWAGPNGGWLEAPHYATVSLDHIIAIGYAMKNAGLETPLYHKNLKKAILWLAKISTPPDIRFKDFRHLPPIGNTWLFETSCLFAYMAKAYSDRDPEYANAMRWMWEQQGRPMYPGIGGAYPTTDGYRELLVDLQSAQGQPSWGSELFHGSGAILRSGFPGIRETQLYLIQGHLHEHYDDDQGSFELWGKGRPLCLDFGYNGSAPAWQHNRLDLGRWFRNHSSGRIVSFDTQPGADYVRSKLSRWDRQIIFVKDENPLGPNYFVMRDSLGIWSLLPRKLWLWLYTDLDPMLEGTTVHVTGRHDVDTDVWFSPSFEQELSAQRTQDQRIKTRLLSIKTHSAGSATTDQRGLNIALKAGRSMLWAIYPRLRDQDSAAFSIFAAEQGVKIESEAGIDYIFLGRKSFSYREKNLKFKGTAGVVQIRKRSVRLTLHSGELVEYADKKLTRQGTTREYLLID